MKRIIVIVLSLSIVLAFLFWRFSPSFMEQKPKGPITLTYWGLLEEKILMEPVISQFEAQNPNIKVKYYLQSPTNYRTRVQTQIREGVGPDVFKIHNSWLPMFINDLAPAPKDVLSIAEYKENFYPVAVSSFVRGENIYGAPTEIDGLALYVNVELLAGVGNPPQNWREFIDTAVKMTVRDSSTGQIQTAGAALGTATNVDHWSDILGLLILQQPGASLENPATSPTAEVLRFYTGFVTDPRKKTWDLNLSPSTQMFTQGKLGYFFAPSWRARELRAANPNLKFKVVPVPQLSSAVVAWANFWSEGVSKTSKNPKEAWIFAKFLTSKDAQRILFDETSKANLFGKPFSRIDLAGELSNDPILGAYVAQGPIYKSWYLSSNTLEGDINFEIIKYFKDAVDQTLAGSDPQAALQNISSGVTQVLNQYR